MTKKSLPIVEVTLDRIVGGGQTLGTLATGKKLFTWGGLPGERVNVQITKKKSNLAEGIVTDVITASEQRIEPRDVDSYLSTSPWQIMDFDTEQHYKSALIEEAFELHDIVLPHPIDVYSDGIQYEYRNKIEYSFWYDTDNQHLDLAFYRRGTHGKIAIDHTSLASPAITDASRIILKALNDQNTEGRALKTLIIRSNRAGEVAWQLYVKDEQFDAQTLISTITIPSAVCGEIIYSNPKSPASVITKRLTATSENTLTDTILDVPFSYATEGFFQINLPVYEQALRDMQKWVTPDQQASKITPARVAGDEGGRVRERGEGAPVIDLYSGVGTIGLTIGGTNITLIEINEHAVREMERNIQQLGRQNQATAVLAPSENALDHITSDSVIIVDPPRAGLHQDVIAKLLETAPRRIIYLSCNPVTQARDVMHLAQRYGIRHHQGYNFFPRTPHIEHLIVLDLK